MAMWKDKSVIFVLCLFALQAVALSLIRSGTSFDGAEQLLYTQYFAWGYGRSQPPLYTWMLIGLHRVIGVSMLAEYLLKFGLMFLGFWSVAEIALRLGYSRWISAAAMFALFLIVEIGWESQRNYAHTVLMFALCGLLGVAYLSTRAAPTWPKYLLLGLVSGLLVLSKYNGALVIAALVAADLIVGRPRVFARRASAIVWPVMVLVMMPHFIWVIGNAEQALVLADNFRNVEAMGVGAAVFRGLWQYLLATVALLAPPALVLAALAAFSGRTAYRGESSPERRVIAAWGLALWILGLIVTLATGAIVVRMRWLVPVAVMAMPILVGEVLSRRRVDPRLVLGGGMILGFVLVAGQWIESTRANARTNFDYARLAQDLQAGGYAVPVITFEYEIFANLRLHGFPIIAYQMPGARMTGESGTALWTSGNQRAEERLAQFVAALGLCASGEAPARELLLHPRLGRSEPRRVSALPVSAGACDE